MPFQGTHFFGATPFYNGIATQSLRFDDGSSAYLSRTFSSDVDNDKKMTISVWVKRGIISNATQVILSNYTGVRFLGELSFRSDDKIVFRPGGNGDGASNSYSVQTTAQFRDVSSWYHLVLAYDSTQSTDTDRVELYVNGTEQTLEPLTGSHSFPPENYAHEFSYNGANNAVGYYSGFNSNYLDAHICDLNFIDGLTLDQDSFGETKNGVWIAKEYTGSYGTNGYRLEFKQTGTSQNSSGIGADTSGNTHHWAVTNLVASDSNLPDSPENNFATLNPLIKPHDALTFSEGNLKISRGSGSLVYSFAGSTFAVKTGKWYAEWRPTGSQTAANHMVGISTVDNPDQSSGDPYLENGQINYLANGTGHIDAGGNVSAGTFSSSSSYGDGDVVGIALDLDSGTKNVKFYKNGTQVNSTNLSSHFDDKHIYFYNVFYNTNAGMWNFGQDSTFAGNETAATNADGNGIGEFHESVPSGYLALCSSNLTEPIIGPNSATQSDDHFNSVLYTGNASTRSITGVGFQPDWVWFKPRSDTDNHVLIDSSRGGTKYLMSNRPDAEITQDPGITAFGTDGFSIGNWTNVNQNTETYVAWNWLMNGGTTSSNDDGSITSTVQANTTAQQSIVLYSGSSSSITVGHGLDSAPEWVLIKSRTHSERWTIFQNSDSQAYHYLNEQFARQTGNADERFGNSSSVVVPTSTVVTLGANNSDVSKNGENYVMYCFSEVEGYSKFGIHEGNNDSDGTFVYAGFRPAWLMVKNIDTAGEDWHIFDNKRAPSNVMKARLIANENTQENTNDNIIDFVSNGFKWRDNNAGYNSGATFIYFAFAEVPFKYANAR